MGKHDENRIRSTTVIAVKRNGSVAMAGDGQVTAGNTVVKGNARKVRKQAGNAARKKRKNKA